MPEDPTPLFTPGPASSDEKSVSEPQRRAFSARKRYRTLLRWGSGLVAVLFLALLLVCIHLRPNDQPLRIVSTDYWENARLVGQLIFSLDGGEGLVFNNDNVQQKNPYVVGLAGVGHLLGWNANQVLLGMASLNVFLLAGALVRFGRRWTHGRVPWGLLIAVPLLFWGKGFFQSNEYHLATLPMTAAYPSTFSFALALFSLSLLVDVCQLEGERKGLKTSVLVILAALPAACVALTHPLTFLCFFVPVAGLTGLIFARSKRAWARSLLVFPALALCLLFWPWPQATYQPLLNYLNLEKTGHPQQQVPSPQPPAKPDSTTEKTVGKEKSVSFDADVYQKHYKINKMLSRAPAIPWGLALLALLAGFHRRRREVWGLVAAVTCFLLAWAVTGYLLKITMGYRFLYFGGLFLQLAAATCLWEFSAGRRRWWLVSVAVLAIIVLIPGRDCLKENRQRYFASWPPQFLPTAQLEEIRTLTGRQAVLAGNDVSYYLPAFSIKRAWGGRIHMVRNSSGLATRVIRPWLEDQTDANLAQAAQATKASWLLFDKALDGDAAPERAAGAASRAPVLRLPAESPRLQKAFESERYILFRIQPDPNASADSSTPASPAEGETGTDS
jgi:hypothetical protein